jgi:hypothetical protein
MLTRDHRTLLAKGGLYARLWAHQSGGFLGDDDEVVPPAIEPELADIGGDASPHRLGARSAHDRPPAADPTAS